VLLRPAGTLAGLFTKACLQIYKVSTTAFGRGRILEATATGWSLSANTKNIFAGDI